MTISTEDSLSADARVSRAEQKQSLNSFFFLIHL